MKTVEIILLRHGKTYCNEKHIYCGKTDIDLSDLGRIELKDRNFNNYQRCDYYFTSGLKRANSTFELLIPNIKYDIIKDFSEYDFGEFELKSYEDLKDLKEYQDWISDKTFEVRCPKGENIFEFKARIQKAFNELVKYLIVEDKKTALGVIHGGVIGMILESIYDDSKKFYEWQPSNGFGYILTIDILDDNNYKILKVEQI